MHWLQDFSSETLGILLTESVLWASVVEGSRQSPFLWFLLPVNLRPHGSQDGISACRPLPSGALNNSMCSFTLIYILLGTKLLP